MKDAQDKLDVYDWNGLLVVAKEIYRFICEIKKPTNTTNNFMFIEDIDR